MITTLHWCLNLEDMWWGFRTSMLSVLERSAWRCCQANMSIWMSGMATKHAAPQPGIARVYWICLQSGVTVCNLVVIVNLGLLCCWNLWYDRYSFPYTRNQNPRELNRFRDCMELNENNFRIITRILTGDCRMKHYLTSLGLYDYTAIEVAWIL